MRGTFRINPFRANDLRHAKNSAGLEFRPAQYIKGHGTVLKLYRTENGIVARFTSKTIKIDDIQGTSK